MSVSVYSIENCDYVTTRLFRYKSILAATATPGHVPHVTTIVAQVSY